MSKYLHRPQHQTQKLQTPGSRHYRVARHSAKYRSYPSSREKEATWWGGIGSLCTTWSTHNRIRLALHTLFGRNFRSHRPDPGRVQSPTPGINHLPPLSRLVHVIIVISCVGRIVSGFFVVYTSLLRPDGAARPARMFTGIQGLHDFGRGVTSIALVPQHEKNKQTNKQTNKPGIFLRQTLESVLRRIYIYAYQTNRNLFFSRGYELADY